MHLTQNEKRSNHLVTGYIRHYRSKGGSGHFPSDIILTIFNLYFPLHGRWIDKNITIESENGVFLSLHHITGYGGDAISYPTAGFVDSDTREDKQCDLWRLYPVKKGGGFIIRPIDINMSEGFAWNSQCKYLGRRQRDGEPFPDKLKKATALRLIQTADCAKDEYHIQSLKNEHYLSVQYKQWHHKERYHIQPSKTYKVRIKSHRRYLALWRRKLNIGSSVWIQSEFNGNELFYRGKVVDFWNGDHEDEIKVHFMGFPDGYKGQELYDVPRFRDKVIEREEWIPIGADYLCKGDCKNPLHEHRVMRWMTNGGIREVGYSVIEYLESIPKPYHEWKGFLCHNPTQSLFHNPFDCPCCRIHMDYKDLGSPDQIDIYGDKIIEYLS